MTCRYENEGLNAKKMQKIEKKYEKKEDFGIRPNPRHA